MVFNSCFHEDKVLFSEEKKEAAEMVDREIRGYVLELARSFPVVLMTGPRQSGKTTLARMLFPDKPYVNLETPATRDLFDADPLGFLARFPDGAIFDEAQNAPELASYLQGLVDGSRRMGSYVLTGSQHFGLSATVSQSLAGRAGVAELLPFSYAELAANRMLPATVCEYFVHGSYPPVYDRGIRPSVWYKSYVSTYLERDLRAIINVRDLGAFQDFLTVCAAAAGQPVNLSRLGGACGIDAKTAKAWLGVLQASYVVHTLRPYFRNFSKRVTRKPKLYFTDTGLLCHLLGLRDPKRIEADPTRAGVIFENLIVSELRKSRLNRGGSDMLHFWRQEQGVEVDIVIDHGTTIEPLEVKYGMTPKTDFAMPLEKFVTWSGGTAAFPKVVYGGNERLRVRGVEYLPWREFLELKDTHSPAS